MTPEANLIEVPTSWDAVTLGQFRALAAADNDDLAAKMRVIVPDFARVAESEAPKLLEALSFLTDVSAAFSHPVPDTLTVDGAEISLPQHLGSETTLIQRWSLQSQLEGKVKQEKSYLDVIDHSVTLLSIYLYPAITGKPYEDIKQARSIEDKILALPCTQALALSDFFLSKYKNPKLSGRMPSKTPPPKARQKSTLTRLFRSLVSSTPGSRK